MTGWPRCRYLCDAQKPAGVLGDEDAKAVSSMLSGLHAVQACDELTTGIACIAGILLQCLFHICEPICSRIKLEYHKRLERCISVVQNLSQHFLNSPFSIWFFPWKHMRRLRRCWQFTRVQTDLEFWSTTLSWSIRQSPVSPSPRHWTWTCREYFFRFPDQQSKFWCHPANVHVFPGTEREVYTRGQLCGEGEFL